jgi:SAM-dependent methyltransferase
VSNTPNAYSSTWFEQFLRPIPPAQTQREIQFLLPQLPLPRYRRILDLCCGEGRHAGELARLGYDVTAIDANEHALAVARQRIGNAARWIAGDMRQLDRLTDRFDAVICLWQSFGYFDEVTNVAVLRSMAKLLAPGGRLILDVYNREFFQRNQGTRTFETAGGMRVTETKELTGRRLRVRLDYASVAQVDQFDWEVFTPAELSDVARSMGLRRLLACSGFDEASPPAPELPRMQIVLQADGS